MVPMREIEIRGRHRARRRTPAGTPRVRPTDSGAESNLLLQHGISSAQLARTFLKAHRDTDDPSVRRVFKVCRKVLRSEANLQALGL